MVHFGDQEVKSQGHRRLKLDMEAWRRHYCEKKAKRTYTNRPTNKSTNIWSKNPKAYENT